MKKNIFILLIAIQSIFFIGAMDDSINSNHSNSKKRRSSINPENIDHTAQPTNSKKSTTQILEENLNDQVFFDLIKTRNIYNIIDYLKKLDAINHIKKLILIYQNRETIRDQSTSPIFNINKANTWAQLLPENFNTFNYLIENNHLDFLKYLLDFKDQSIKTKIKFPLGYGNNIPLRKILLNQYIKGNKETLFFLARYGVNIFYVCAPQLSNETLNSLMQNNLLLVAYNNKDLDFIVKAYTSIYNIRKINKPNDVSLEFSCTNNPIILASHFNDTKLFNIFMNIIDKSGMNIKPYNDFLIKKAFLEAINSNSLNIIDLFITQSKYKSLLLSNMKLFLETALEADNYNVFNKLHNYCKKHDLNELIKIQDVVMLKCKNLNLFKDYFDNNCVSLINGMTIFNDVLNMKTCFKTCSIDIVNYVLESIPNISTYRSKDGESLLYIAAECNRLDILESLIKINPDILNDAANSLLISCYNLNIDIVNFILNLKPDLIFTTELRSNEKALSLLDIVYLTIKDNPIRTDDKKDLYIFNKFINLFMTLDNEILIKSSYVINPAYEYLESLKNHSQIGLDSNLKTIEIYIIILMAHLDIIESQDFLNFMELEYQPDYPGIYLSMELIQATKLYSSNNIFDCISSMEFDCSQMYIIKYLLSNNNATIKNNIVTILKSLHKPFSKAFSDQQNLIINNLLNNQNINDAFINIKKALVGAILSESLKNIEYSLLMHIHRNQLLEKILIFIPENEFFKLIIENISLNNTYANLLLQNYGQEIYKMIDIEGNNIMHYAMKCNNPLTVKTLIIKTKDLIFKSNFKGIKPLEILVNTNPILLKSLFC